MTPILAIAGTELRRLVRDKSNIFFVFILPLLLVLLIGMQFGGSFAPRLALHVGADAGPLGEELVAAVGATEVFELVPVDDPQAVVDAVSSGSATAGLTVPAGYDAMLRSGGEVDLGYVARQDGSGMALQATVESVVAEQNALVRAARLAVTEGDGDFDGALAAARVVAEVVPSVGVTTERLGESDFADFDNLGQFDLGASSQLLLFVFLTSLSGSAALIQTRQWGVATRMMSTPTSSQEVVLGTALGRYLIALVQALYIVIGTAVVFGVNWGDPLGAAAVILSFCLVSAAAGMLLGAAAHNDAQAGGLGVFLGLGLGALGGSMAPMEVFPETVRRVAHLVTPHAWGNDAFAELVRRDGGIGDILPELGVLIGVGLVLLALASWRLHRVTTRPS